MFVKNQNYKLIQNNSKKLYILNEETKHEVDGLIEDLVIFNRYIY